MPIENDISRWAKKTLAVLGVEGSEIDIYLVSDELMHELNLSYRKKDKPTTVLSFEAPDIPRPDTKYKHLGEVYLAPKYISAHNEDIRRLLVHGILHLLGFDHIRKADADLMERKEEETIKKAGFNIS
ncbi:MAG: rRNA maturation RNase YbeY [Candidatus Colwellbacteria bacterium]|nr:rRNA maturation RNase YbeY [Candidatus Colwellbacteria bacterium]